MYMQVKIGQCHNLSAEKGYEVLVFLSLSPGRTRQQESPGSPTSGGRWTRWAHVPVASAYLYIVHCVPFVNYVRVFIIHPWDTIFQVLMLVCQGLEPGDNCSLYTQITVEVQRC